MVYRTQCKYSVPDREIIIYEYYLVVIQKLRNQVHCRKIDR